MSLVQQLTDFATRIGQEIRGVRTLVNGNASSLAGLNTTAKGNLVAAINELQAEIIAFDPGTPINDTTVSLTSTYSSQKITDEIVTAIDNVTAGAPGAHDTLSELASAIGDDANFASTVTLALGNRVRFDQAQTLSSVQQITALSNLGIGDPNTDFVAAFEAAL